MLVLLYDDEEMEESDPESLERTTPPLPSNTHEFWKDTLYESNAESLNSHRLKSSLKSGQFTAMQSKAAHSKKRESLFYLQAL